MNMTIVYIHTYIINMCVYIYIYMYLFIVYYVYTLYHLHIHHCLHTCICLEFKDVVFEDVVFDNNSSVTPYYVTSKYRTR